MAKTTTHPMVFFYVYFFKGQKAEVAFLNPGNVTVNYIA